MSTRAPSAHELASRLGGAQDVWDAIVASLAERFAPLGQEWKPSKSDFGRMCLIRHGTRTLLYLTPEKETVVAAVVLGERAVALALASDLPDAIKTLIREARPYAEGRGIRFPVPCLADAAIVQQLVTIKTSSR